MPVRMVHTGSAVFILMIIEIHARQEMNPVTASVINIVSGIMAAVSRLCIWNEKQNSMGWEKRQVPPFHLRAAGP